MNCFNGAYAFQTFPAHLKAMKKKIPELSAKEMDSTDGDAWVDYFCSEYEIDLVVMYPESKDIDISEKTVQEYNTWYQISRNEPEFFDRPGYKATCKVPFSGDPGLFELQPNPPHHGRKSFENVLESIQGALDEHAIRARSIKRGQWYCEIQNAEDERVMHVTVQAFNLHV